MIKELVGTVLGTTLLVSGVVLVPQSLVEQDTPQAEAPTSQLIATPRVVTKLNPTPVETEPSGPATSDVQAGVEELPVVEPEPEARLITADEVAKRSDETIFKTMATQTGVTWGLDTIDGSVDGSYNYISDGSGVRVYIVDTGVDATHREFGSRVVDGFDAYGQNLDQTDCHGHGTHVAAIAAGSYYGVAKDSTIVPVRVMDCNGVGNTTTLTDGIEWILASHSGGVGIVNMSIGGNKDEEVNALTSRLVSAGFVVVAAAGNSNKDACQVSPAGAPGVIAVAAVDRDSTKASFSNWGSCVDVSAPGVGINSANAENHSVSRKMSGTSQASPFVAGAIATYLSQGAATTPTTAESLMDELAEGGVVRVQVEPEESVDPTPEPIVEPEPEPQTPEPTEPPVVEEPILPEYSVEVIQESVGSNVGLLRWSEVPDAQGYKVYKTGSIRPGWRLHWVAESTWFERTVVDKVGSIAIYRVVALVGSREVEVGTFEYMPK